MRSKIIIIKGNYKPNENEKNDKTYSENKWQ